MWPVFCTLLPVLVTSVQAFTVPQAAMTLPDLSGMSASDTAIIVSHTCSERLAFYLCLPCVIHAVINLQKFPKSHKIFLISMANF